MEILSTSVNVLIHSLSWRKAANRSLLKSLVETTDYRRGRKPPVSVQRHGKSRRDDRDWCWLFLNKLDILSPLQGLLLFYGAVPGVLRFAQAQAESPPSVVFRAFGTYLAGSNSCLYLWHSPLSFPKYDLVERLLLPLREVIAGLFYFQLSTAYFQFSTFRCPYLLKVLNYCSLFRLRSDIHLFSEFHTTDDLHFI